MIPRIIVLTLVKECTVISNLALFFFLSVLRVYGCGVGFAITETIKGEYSVGSIY